VGFTVRGRAKELGVAAVGEARGGAADQQHLPKNFNRNFKF
jgi:hypothetical protein